MWQTLARLLAGWLCVGLGLVAGAADSDPQDGSPPARPYSVRRWTTEDGLPQNRIACLAQTPEGYLWIGTWYGLVRFDGLGFTVFNSQNTPALVSATINSLAVDEAGALWVATSDGVVKYTHGHFRRFARADGLPGKEVWQVMPARDGGLWLRLSQAVVRVAAERCEVIWEHGKDVAMHNLDEDSAGRLNLFLLARQDSRWSAEWRVWTNNLPSGSQVLARASTDVFVGALAPRTPGVAFAGMDHGLGLLSAASGPPQFVGGLDGGAVRFCAATRDGVLWAQGADTELRQWDGQTWRTVNLGEARDGVVCAYQDAQGNHWFGTEQGLVQLRYQRVRTFTRREGLPSDNVWSVCEDADQTLWVGLDNGLAVRRGTEFQVAQPLPGWLPAPVRALWPDAKGGVWANWPGRGLARSTGEQTTLVLPTPPASALYVDRAGRVWLGSAEGLTCYAQGQVQPLSPAWAALRAVHAIYEDRRGDFWFGTQTGLAHARDARCEVIAPTAGGPTGGVWAICEDREGALWLGTERGLVRGAAGRYFAFTARHGLPEETVNCVLEDDAGCLWLSTLNGIYRVERERLTAVAEGRETSVQTYRVGVPDGLLSAETNGENQAAGWKAHDGRLWFPTVRGLAVLDPRDFARPETAPTVHWESVTADGEELPLGTDGCVRIPPDRSHALAIRYTACDLAAPEQLRFRTRWPEGADWSALTANRAVHFFHLRPGRYRLEVEAVDHHGLRSPAPATLDLVVAPHYWQTWWFYLACGGGAVALVVGVQAYRLRWQMRLLGVEQQRALANERARIARDLHDDLGTALTGMALELDVLGREAQPQPTLARRLGDAAQHARNLANRMREVVWVVNPRCDNLRSFVDFLTDQAAGLLQKAGLRVRLDLPLDVPELPMNADVRHHLALSLREALTNVVRHAQATEAVVHLAVDAQQLVLHVRDNGRGFIPPTPLPKGHGLANLTARLQEIGGQMHCQSTPGTGTTLTLSVPLNQLSPQPA